MDTFTTHQTTLELHCIKRPFLSVRQQNGAAMRQLHASIAELGQQLPVIVVADQSLPGQQWLLIDGYRRVQVLEQSHQDTVEVEVWECEPNEALLRVLAQSNQRSWSALEQAGLIEILQSQYNCSQSDIARRLGRDKSWVSRRISLLHDIGDEVAAEVYSGVLTPWAATRVIMPLARANNEHSQKLLSHLKQTSHSTRELQEFFKHYQSSNKQARENMVNEPDLFFKSLQIHDQDRQAAALAKGPEGLWEDCLQIVRKELKKLQPKIAQVFYQYQKSNDRERLTNLFDDCFKQFEQTAINLRRHLNDIDQNQRDDPDAA